VLFSVEFVCYVISATLRENSYSCLHKTFRIDGQWLMDHAIKFDRWQHPAKGRGRALLRLETLLSDKIRQLSQRSI